MQNSNFVHSYFFKQIAMQCPACNNKGNVLKRIFIRHSGSKNRFCMYCNAEVQIKYNWKKIFRLCLVVMLILFLANMIIQMLGAYGLSSGFAGGVAGAVIAIMMRNPPYTTIELVKQEKKKRRH